MICKQCNKNEVVRFTKLGICNSCYVANYRKAHPEKYNYRYSGNKHKALKRDNYICQHCGDTKKLLIHHIDGNGKSKNGKLLKVEEQNNKLDNLITLCYKCHTRLHEPNRLKKEQWARDYNSCLNCGTIEKPHEAKGLCVECYQKEYDIENADKNSKRKAKWYQTRRLQAIIA